MKLVPEWRSLWRSHSVWFQAASVAFFTLIEKVTDASTQVWLALPADIKATFPPGIVYWFGVFLGVGGIVAKLYVQQRLTDARDSAQQNSGPDS